MKRKIVSLLHYPSFSQEKFWFIEKRGEIRLREPLATSGNMSLKVLTPTLKREL